MYADSLGQKLKRPMRVIGWYHSHPHITVWPSHVDVRTQADYQMMDRCFVGFIFSVFNIDKTKQESQIQVTCFQSVQKTSNPHEFDRKEVPLYVDKKLTYEAHNLHSLISLPKVLLTEESIAYRSTIPADKDSNLVTQVYNSSVYSASVCHILDTLVTPLMRSLTNKLEQNKITKERLLLEKQHLQTQINSIAPSASQTDPSSDQS